jgi:hypothetical protein
MASMVLAVSGGPTNTMLPASSRNRGEASSQMSFSSMRGWSLSISRTGHFQMSGCICAAGRGVRARHSSTPHEQTRAAHQNQGKSNACDKVVVTRFRARRNRTITDFRTRRRRLRRPGHDHHPRGRPSRIDRIPVPARQGAANSLNTGLSASALRPGMNGSWFISALAWPVRAFRRNPAALVGRNATHDILARTDHQFLKY